MTWQDRAVELKAQGKSWTKLPEILEKEYGFTLNYNKIRSAVRRRTSKEKQDTPEDIQSTIIGLLGKEDTRYPKLMENIRFVETSSHRTTKLRRTGRATRLSGSA